MDKSNRTTLNPYLAFTGNCREAITFYKESLVGELDIRTFEGSPMNVPEGFKDKVLHAVLKFGNATIMASDSMPGQYINHGDSIHI